MAGAITESRSPSVNKKNGAAQGSRGGLDSPGKHIMRKPAVLLAVSLTGFMSLANASESEKGKQVFTQEAQPSCTVCHTLSDAGSAGAIGPNLDELKPSREQVINAVTGGVGIMPAFEDSLSSEQIQAVARYVSHVTGGEK